MSWKSLKHTKGKKSERLEDTSVFKWDDIPGTIQGTVRAEILAPGKSAPPRFPPDSIRSARTYPLAETRGQGGNHQRRENSRSSSSSFYPLQFRSSNNRTHGESSLPGTGFAPVAETSKTGCSLATKPCAPSPSQSAGAGRGALRKPGSPAKPPPSN